MSGASGTVFLTTFDYQTGLEGRWYYPTSGGNLSTLIDHGTGTSAAAGLYHYTVRVDQTKDSGTVDIGFHYVAVDGNGNPIDTDGDGLPDYLEDKNGDGLSTGESSFTNSDTDGDGLSDGVEVSLGLDPLVNQAAQSGSRRNISYDRADQLKALTGAATLGLTLDAEGNIEAVTP
jgi:hypothetical protein